jgi:hypothetical protein
MLQAWSVDGHRIEFQPGMGMLRPPRLTIDGIVDETCRVKFSRPNHEFKVGPRRLVLKTNGGFGELWSKRLLVPPSRDLIEVQPAPSDAKCARHLEAPATFACAHCGSFVCAQCEACDGTHCRNCVPIVTEEDVSRMVLASAGPMQALALFGGPAGKILGFAADVSARQIDRHVDSPGQRSFFKTLLFLAVAAAFIAAIVWLGSPR